MDRSDWSLIREPVQRRQAFLLSTVGNSHPASIFCLIFRGLTSGSDLETEQGNRPSYDLAAYLELHVSPFQRKYTPISCLEMSLFAYHTTSVPPKRQSDDS